MKAHVILTIAVVGLAGCPIEPRVAPTVFQAVPPRPTNVQVKDSPDSDPQNPRCPRQRILEVNQEPIHVFLGNAPDQPPVPINWQLDRSGFKFNPTGDPTPAPGSGSPAGHIHDCRAVGSGANYQCQNDARSRGAWKYKLSVTAADGCRVDDLDPWIVNN